MLPLLGQLAMWGIGVPLASYGVSRLIEGSPEDQMRRQMETQDQLEMERVARMGGGMMEGGELGGLVGGGPRDLAGLMAEDQMLSELSDAAYSLDRARNARWKGSDELERVLEGQTARIAALQSERTMSPLEIIQMMEMMRG